METKQDTNGRWKWVAIVAGGVAILAGVAAFLNIPTVGDLVTEVEATRAHAVIDRKVDVLEKDNKKDHDRIFEALREQRDDMKAGQAKQEARSERQEKMLWSILREVKK